MVSANNAGMDPWRMNANEAKQTMEMQQLTTEFPLVDELVIVDVYYNKANQNL